MTEEKKDKEEVLEEEETTEEETEEEKEETEEAKEPEPENEEDEALETKYMRLMADFQNFRKRTEKEKSDIYLYANESIVLKLLNVLDSFERALEHKDNPDEAFADGMEKIFKQLKDVLTEHHVEEIDALGREFDPNYHNAVVMEAKEGYESNTVCEVLQKGYTLNGKVIRPAMVKVAE